MRRVVSSAHLKGTALDRVSGLPREERAEAEENSVRSLQSEQLRSFSFANWESMEKIKKIVVIGGCGHVGLPLGIVFANCGVDVALLDLDHRKIDQVNKGQMPFLEANAQEKLEAVVGKKLVATADPACLRDCDAAIAVLGTPVDEHLNPTVTDLYKSIDDVIVSMPEKSLLVLRSTVYPGVTKLVHERLQSSGRNILLAFCPERIAEGKAMEEIQALPQIISAFDDDSMSRVRELFSIINDDLIELSPLEAELAKLFTNSWRYMNFAISNQFYVLAESYGLDFQRIYTAVTHRYPRMRSFAKAGFAAGPCLLKDTLQLSAFSGNNFFLGHSAMLINEGLPNFIVNQLRKQQDLREKVVAVLGMAFKGESDDKRESLSYKLRKLLMVEAKEVLCTDPYVPDAKLVPLGEVMRRADIFILGAPHAAYRDLHIASDKTIVDVWGFWPSRH
jgi:UDP-N-acetyl-D-mannosaminuronic acid dehydrogenase